MSHQITNSHTAYIGSLAPGATATVSDSDFALLLKSPLFRSGKLTCPGITPDGEDMSDIVVETTEYTHTGAADVPALFVVSGGEIELYDLAEVVTVALSSDTSVGKFQHVANQGPTTTDLCTTTSVASAGIGKHLQMPSAVGSALIVSNVGEVAINGKPVLALGPGTIKFNLSGNTTGKGIFKMRYRKLDPAAIVTPSF